MAYRNKTYVCFDADNDMHYYRLMQAWHQSDYTKFSFFDAHDLNYARDSSMEYSIKRQLKERLWNTKIFVVLIGESTRYLTKFVKWEMEQALDLRLPIIAVNLNGMRQQDTSRCPPTIKDELCLYVSYGPKILQHAFENWPELHQRKRAEGVRGAFYYSPDVYRQIGA